jgi:hypothetical protein
MASSFAREIASRAWGTEKTSKMVFDVDLAEAFADIIDELTNKPWLGNATNKDIIEELSARVTIGSINPDYKTNDPNNG